MSKDSLAEKREYERARKADYRARRRREAEVMEAMERLAPEYPDGAVPVARILGCAAMVEAILALASRGAIGSVRQRCSPGRTPNW